VEIPTFSNEELLATKLRALLQRNKGRDLVDLSHAFEIFTGLNADRIVELFGRYLALSNQTISRAEAERRMFEKLERPNFLADVPPLLTADAAAGFDEKAAMNAFEVVFGKLIRFIPGDPWANTPEMLERFGLTVIAKS
jgi:hypothetical protein